MRVLYVSSEIHPLAKTGGLADVSKALPSALSKLGIDVQLFTPGYPSALDAARHKRVVATIDNILGFDGVRLVQAVTPDHGIPVWLVDCPALYARDGGPYLDRHGNEWPDNALRFAMLNHVAARLSLGQTPVAWRPDLVHAHDWHAGLLPALLSAGREERPASLFTIHNMAFQGNFPAHSLASANCDPGQFHTDGFGGPDEISFLRAGIHYSDYVTTVSHTYASEIMTPEFGCGLDGLLRRRAGDLAGILNGVDYGTWDPRQDQLLAQRYSADDLSGKQACKRQLQEGFGLEADPARPVVAFMSRLAHQKMADSVLESLPWIAAQGAQFVLVAEGDKGLEAAFRDAAAGSPDIGVQIGYDEPSAHRLLAGADILLAPSRYEPCGLTHLYAMRYGTIPVVRRTGGLADTVREKDAGAEMEPSRTGYLFDEPSTDAMIRALDSALTTYRYPHFWRQLMLNCMSADFGWEESAQRYFDLYRQLAGQSGAVGARFAGALAATA